MTDQTYNGWTNWEKKLGIPVPEEIVKEDADNTTPSEYNSTHTNKIEK